jgi:hypothetical protein
MFLNKYFYFWDKTWITALIGIKGLPINCPVRVQAKGIRHSHSFNLLKANNFPKKYLKVKKNS